MASPVRDVCGIASTNNPADPEQVFFRARMADLGEPGGLDQFGLKLSTGYLVSPRQLGTAKPGAGNVELHDYNPSTMLPPVDEDVQCGGLKFGGKVE